MWGFVLIAGTISWLTLLRILKVDTGEDPPIQLFQFDSAHQCGLLKQDKDTIDTKEDEVLVGETTEWKSFCHKGRRKFIGEVLEGLPREERGETLRFFRQHQQYMDMEPIEWLIPYRHYLSFPVSYYTTKLSERVKRRILAPIVWEGGRTFSVSYSQWADAVHRWYSSDEM